MNKKDIHTTIFQLYELPEKDDPNPAKTSATIRRMVNRHFQKEHPGKTWEQLSPLLQQRFTHLVMYFPILDNHVKDPEKQKRIKTKITKDIDMTFRKLIAYEKRTGIRLLP